MKKKINGKKIICIMFLIVLLFSRPVFADVGSFESYDSGSSWSGSSGGSSDSWDYGDSDSRGNELQMIFLVFLIFGVLFFIMSKIIDHQMKNKTPQRTSEDEQRDIPGMYEENVLTKVKLIDPDFNKEDFILWSKTLFVKLQEAWTICDWETIRTFETKELFEQHKAQLQGYINNHTVNVMDQICVNYAYLYSFKQESEQDILTIELNSSMVDYIMDANNGKVLRGDKTTKRTNTYLLTFIRTTGVKTTKMAGKTDTTNCPNCGAPTKITASGKCEYCGSVIITDTHDWVLANLQRK